jgi:lantibiotic biosynthesis protein
MMTTVTTRTLTWSPILGGQSREKAVTAVCAIAQSLSDILRKAEASGDDETSDPTLARGSAGFATLFTYLAQAGLVDGADEVAEQFLDRAADAVGTLAAQPSLYAGFTGIAWASTHLEQRLFVNDGEDPCAAIDVALADYLSESPWREDYDLISGIVGIGVYALERLPRPSARSLLTRVVHLLAATAQCGVDEACWLTDPEHMPAWQQELFPKGSYNVGLAHGIPGVIALLAGACAADVAETTARPLLHGAVRWLLRRRLPPELGSGFPAWIVPGARPEPCRAAWCYGAPGVAAALMCAGQALGNDDWQGEAIAIARSAAILPADETGVIDAGLCHGAAGLGHVFNRLFQASGDRVLAEAARFWLDRAVDMREPGRGVAGYEASRAGNAPPDVDAGLLEGAAGIALSLLGGVAAIEPAWDRMLMLSLAPLTARLD